MNKMEAVYNRGETDFHNPFAEAMPPELKREEYFAKIKYLPEISHDISLYFEEGRRKELGKLNTICIPQAYMYEIYDVIYRGILTNYQSVTQEEQIRQINKLWFTSGQGENVISQSYSGALLGSSGIGKTLTLKRSLSLFPQLILHKKYNGTAFYCNQITYLFLECPCDCSVKSLALNIVSAIDSVLGSQYLKSILKIRNFSVSALMMQVKVMCLNHHVGMLIVDEIQNAVLTANRNGQMRQLLKFLVELTNEACVSVYFSGTLEADELFSEEAHLFRRTRGYRLLPMKPDRTYYSFIRNLWDYQVTPKKAELDEHLISHIYGLSRGITAYIVKIFQEAQIQALLSGVDCITKDTIDMAVRRNQINVVSVYENGVSISDFGHLLDEPGKDYVEKKKGRPVGERDSFDLLVMAEKAETPEEFIQMLSMNGLLERVES